MYLHQILAVMRKYKLKWVEIGDGMITGVTWKGEDFKWRLVG